MSNKDGAGNDSEDDATQKVEIVTNAETTETESAFVAGGIIAWVIVAIANFWILSRL